MQPNKVYDEVIKFIASSSPQNVVAFRPSDEVRARIARDLRGVTIREPGLFFQRSLQEISFEDSWFARGD